MVLDLLTSPDAVHKAMDEFDQLGSDEFLRRYGYGKARTYFAVRDGKLYDSKAIVGVAVGKEHPERGPLRHEEFDGGEATVRVKLEQLGIEVRAKHEQLQSAEAQRVITEVWGPPRKPPTRYIAVWRTAAAHDLALQLDQASARVWVDVKPPLLDGLDIQEYGPSKSRHSNLKANAPRLAAPNTAWQVVASDADALRSLLEWYAELAGTPLDVAELEQLRSTFLGHVDGFRTFSDPGEKYSSLERGYKDELRSLFLSEVMPLAGLPMESPEAAQNLAKAFHSILTRKLSASGSTQNLIGWQVVDRFRPDEPQKSELLGRTLAELISGSAADIDRLNRFVTEAGQILRLAGATGSEGAARLVGSSALMLKEPNTFIAIRTELFEEAFARLLHQKFPPYSDEPGRIRLSMDLASKVREHLDTSWAWTPQDFIDVQSFLWVALKYGSPNQTFAQLARAFVEQFNAARTGPFGQVKELWSTMDRLKARLLALPSVGERADILVDWSLGKGNWATVPWISLTDRRATTSIRRGVYCTLLVSNDLNRIYLTLIQGTTDVLDEHGAAGLAVLRDKAAELRRAVPELAEAGFTLSDAIDLGAVGWRGKSYEAATIAFVAMPVDELPSDEQLEVYLEALLSAYERIAAESSSPKESYTIDDALDGLFLDRPAFERILGIWREKKNIVLQGAPGVGKSFVARRLAYALLQEKDPKRLAAVQFHQSYGYEDFVQGYRPTPDGGFELRGGAFYSFARRAMEDGDRDYVFMIDEINRGNLSKILGELMLLVESDKRGPEWATCLAYESDAAPAFYVPANLYIIGMMNTADRSLSLVDYALRRRFAFVTLEPGFAHPTFREHLIATGVPDQVIDRIIGGMEQLNSSIAEDRVNLGPGFRIGHSFFVPTGDRVPAGWFERVIETEIRPLLEEYWFDDQLKAAAWCDRLRSPQ